MVLTLHLPSSPTASWQGRCRNSAKALAYMHGTLSLGLLQLVSHFSEWLS
jgi:hypothetical protein